MERGCHHTRPVAKNLSAPLKNTCQSLGLIIGTSSSPSQLIRTLENLTSTVSSSKRSSTLLPSLPSPHLPLRGLAPTKYTRTPGTSEIREACSPSAGERAILSSPAPVRMVIGPRKQRGRERNTSP